MKITAFIPLTLKFTSHMETPKQRLPVKYIGVDFDLKIRGVRGFINQYVHCIMKKWSLSMKEENKWKTHGKQIKTNGKQMENADFDCKFGNWKVIKFV